MSEYSESKGGFGQFFFSLAMMCIGFYMLLEKITVKSGFHKAIFVPACVVYLRLPKQHYS